MFYDIYVGLCKKHGVAPTRAALDMGFTKGSVSYWKRSGGAPSREILLKMCDYFNVSMDYLSGAKTDSTEQEIEQANPIETTQLPKETAKVPEEHLKMPEEQAEVPVLSEEPFKTSEIEPEIFDPEHNEPDAVSPELFITGAYVKDANIPEFAVQETPFVSISEKLDLFNVEEDFQTLALHEKIRSLRRKKSLTLDEFAQLAGVDKQDVRRWENGDIKGLRRYKLAKVAKVLDTTVASLRGENETSQADEESAEPDTLSILMSLKTRSECMRLLSIAYESSREDVELAASFLRSLKK